MYPSCKVVHESTAGRQQQVVDTRDAAPGDGLRSESPPKVERIHHVSLRDRIVNAIRDAIVQGKLRPGEKIPEHELSAQLGVSRTPIREAIRILEQQGLVETRPKNGTYIAQVDTEDAGDGLLVRTVLEELAVRQAIERLDEEEWGRLCARLEELVEGMDEAIRRADPVAAVELDIEFHTQLIRASRNRYLSDTWRMVGLPTLIWSPERGTYPQSEEDWVEGFTGRHGELLEAIRGGDPEEAATAVRWHISQKLTDIEEYRLPIAEDSE